MVVEITKRFYPPKRILPIIYLLLCLALLTGAGKFAFYIRDLSRLADERFPVQSSGLSPCIYARPLVIHPGLDLLPEDLALELDFLEFQKKEFPDRPGSYSRTGGTFILYDRKPAFSDESRQPSRVRVKIRNQKVISLSGLDFGRSLRRFVLGPLKIGDLDPKVEAGRDPVTIEAVPEPLILSILAVEDRRFYSHGGVDFSAVFRVLAANAREGHIVQGASTITQQVAKILFFSGEDALKRKMSEWLMAWVLEWKFTKDEILEAYINSVYLGRSERGPVIGFGAAGRYYFGKNLAELDWGEMALLSGMLKAPSGYDPVRNAERAKARRDQVLAILAEQGLLRSEEAASAKEAKLHVVPNAPAPRDRFPVFSRFIRGIVDDKKSVAGQGTDVFTFMDPVVQVRAQAAATSGLDFLEARRLLEKGSLETGVVVLSLPRGELIAMVGGRDPGRPWFNRAVSARRQVGSLIKPAVFLAALEDSPNYHLMTRLDDSVVRIENKDGTIWSPANFDGVHHKAVPLYQALSRSYNAACVRLGMELGLDRLEGLLGRLGVGGKMDFYPSSFLGTMTMSPMEVAGMYRTLATGGMVSPIRYIRETGLDGTGRPRPGVQNFDPVPVYLLNMALKMVISEGTARSEANQVIGDLCAAGKTGTTDGLRDSWFAGFTGDLLVVVWVGRDDGAPCKLTGADGAFYIWQKIVTQVSKKAFAPGPPELVKWITVDPNTGRQVLELDCPWAVALPFAAGTEPTEAVSCRGLMPEETDPSWLRTLF